MTVNWPASVDIMRPVKRGKRTGKKRTYPERAIQCAIVKALKKYARPEHGAWCAIPNGGNRSAITGAIMKAEGVRSGAPDMLFVLPPKGRAAFLEFKASNGRLSDTQIEFRDDLTLNGALYAVAHSVDEAWGVLAGWGVLPSAVEGLKDD